MARHSEPDLTLIKMPSLRAVKSFVAAAKHGSFTRAAEALCVTQAAISRQIRELETFLGTELFVRSGRAVKLTADGIAFFDAAQLSFINISQAAERIRAQDASRQSLTVFCSPAFSSLWLLHRLPSFFCGHPEIDLRVIATQNFMTMESSVRPDVIISKLSQVREGYDSVRLFHDVIYPVCSPQYLASHPDLLEIEDIRDAKLLDLNPYGRSQLAEHVDWAVWFAFHGVDLSGRSKSAPSIYSSNDYNALVQLAVANQGISLGWNHLVGHLVEAGSLVRPIEKEVVHNESFHYLHLRTDSGNTKASARFKEWMLTQI
jgi:LysR family transcriptional regulator, glycine cleavage system transcriptional activator